MTQRWNQNVLHVRHGMLAFASMFIMDTTGIPISPMQNSIKAGLHQARELPGVKQTVQADQRPGKGPSFKMR